MSVALEYARQAVEACFQANSEVVITVPAGLAQTTVRQAIYGYLTQVGRPGALRVSPTGPSQLTLVPKLPDQGIQVLGRTANAAPQTHSAPAVSVSGVITSSLHSPKVLAAVKVLLESEVIVGFDIQGLTFNEFSEIYPEYVEHFRLVDKTSSVLLT